MYLNETGSYDKCIYVLDAENGQLVWRVETGDIVKSSPTTNLSSGYIYVGSHDKNVYCLDIYAKQIVWQRDLNSGSIFSSPTCDKAQNLFVTTLGGYLFRLNALNGSIDWSLKYLSH